MELKIFDVEHGACALLTTSNGKQILIDCGYNSTTGWRPSTYLPRNGITTIDKLIVTNYDEDHMNDLPNLIEAVRILTLHRNPTVSKRALFEMKHEHGLGSGALAMADMIDSYTYAVANVDWGDVQVASHYNSYPTDFDSENELSLAVFVYAGGCTFLFPGDMTTIAWLKLLERSDFRNRLSGVHVLIAPHHGREDGLCELLFSEGLLRPELTVISDKPIMHETQRTASWYAQRTTGLMFGNHLRKVLTTRSDGRIRFQSYGVGYYVDFY